MVILHKMSVKVQVLFIKELSNGFLLKETLKIFPPLNNLISIIGEQSSCSVLAPYKIIINYDSVEG